MIPDGPLLASMPIQSTISPFVIDDNTHSTTYAPPFIMLLLCNLCNLCSPFHHASLLSSFGINGKGYPFAVLLYFSIFNPSFIKISAFCFNLIITLLSPPIMMLLLLFLSSCYACFPFVIKDKRGCLFVFSCLVLRRGSHPQFLSEVLKCIPWQGLCKDVYNLLLCLNIFQLDVLFYYMFP